MTNHSHLLIKAETLESLSLLGHFIQRRYAYYYAKTYKWAEQLFKKPFLSIPIESDAYLLECARYSERNPLKADLVKDPGDWPYSSYNYYAQGKRDDLITPNPLHEALGNTPSERWAAYRFYVCQPRLSEASLVEPF